MPTQRACHIPQGDPCTRLNARNVVCGLLAKRHLVDHNPIGDPCQRCGLGMGNHHRTHHATHSERAYYVGIDGEGQGRKDHRYVMLAWSNEDGTRRDAIQAPPGGRLVTEQCLDFLLNMPQAARAFAFAFNYDLTKILEDVDNRSLYMLVRPEKRQRLGEEKFKPPHPVKWRGYNLNMMGSKFSVEKGGKRRIIWDVFKFFQSKFTNALEDWKVGDPGVIARMKEMKDQRAKFDQLTRKQILEYCFDECAYMATLAHKLDDAHDKAGLPLTAYHGAGSSAAALFKRLGIAKTDDNNRQERNGIPAMLKAVAMAFFGGRFENDVIGDIPGPVWGYDISSAYPYQLTFLPCLTCGKWKKTRNRRHLEHATTALVRYKLGKPPKGMHWGPFPFRTDKGSIAFPAQSGGGWVWREEYLQGERLFPHVKFREAWVYHTKCKHRPFAEVPKFYVQRLLIGKEGPGIVIKLGLNSGYGKTAQSLGRNPPFQSWIWAGLITSGCRAQILQMLGMHKDRANMKMVATDGIYGLEKIDPPKPRVTMTPKLWRELAKELTPAELAKARELEAEKPLGGWERKVVEKGMFAVRPGIYFPSNPTKDEIKAVRARGIGRAVLYESWKKAVKAWRAGEPGVAVKKVTRFHGIKSSIGRIRNPNSDSFDDYEYIRTLMPGRNGKRSKRVWYGQWTQRPVVLTFHPMPKREKTNPDNSLKLRCFPTTLESTPYKRSLVSEEAIGEILLSLELSEQPDGDDWADYEE